jgi:hypothetical protein
MLVGVAKEESSGNPGANIQGERQARASSQDPPSLSGGSSKHVLECAAVVICI